jgi:hypothetical protein
MSWSNHSYDRQRKGVIITLLFLIALFDYSGAKGMYTVTLRGNGPSVITSQGAHLGGDPWQQFPSGNNVAGGDLQAAASPFIGAVQRGEEYGVLSLLLWLRYKL